MPDGTTAPVPAAARSGAPVFIVGPMGSGTTLLRLIVDSHDDIAIAQETSIMRAYLAHRWIPFMRHGEWYRRVGWTEDELDARLGEFYRGMFERFAAAQGKSRWGDKTPWHAWHLRELARLFPDAVFLAMVRQPGAVASSMSERFRQTWAGAVGHWVNVTSEQVQRGTELGDRLLLVRYEDLVTEPETTLHEIFDWLQAPWSDRLLAHNEVHAERGTAKKVEGDTRSDQPIKTGRVAAWAKGTTPEQLAVLRRRAGALAPFFGYDAGDPLVLADVSVPGSPRTRTMTGTELATRKAAFPHLVASLESDRTPWAGNAMLLPGVLGLSEAREHEQPAPTAKLMSSAVRPPGVRESSTLLRAAVVRCARGIRRRTTIRFSR